MFLLFIREEDLGGTGMTFASHGTDPTPLSATLL